MRALQQHLVGKSFESAVHDLTSRDRWGEVDRENTMGPGGFRRDSESGDCPSESLEFAIEQKCVQVRISLARGQEVFTTSTCSKVAAKTCQVL